MKYILAKKYDTYIFTSEIVLFDDRQVREYIQKLLTDTTYHLLVFEKQRFGTVKSNEFSGKVFTLYYNGEVRPMINKNTPLPKKLIKNITWD